MSKRIEKELDYMTDMFKDLLNDAVSIKKRYSTVDPNSHLVDYTDKNCIENELRNRTNIDSFNAMNLICSINTAKRFKYVALVLLSNDVIPKKGLISIIQKVETIEKRSTTLLDTNRELGTLMRYALVIAMRTSLYCNVFIDGYSLHQLFAMMFKIAYTLLNSDIDLNGVDTFYKRTMIIMCAAMKRPSKFNHGKMTPVINYNDILYYRISDKIIESKDYLINYIREYYSKCEIRDLNISHLVCSDFMWDLITKYKGAFLKDA